MSTCSVTPAIRHEGGFLDRLGVFLSSACALHCFLMPFALGFLVMNGVEWFASELMELALVGTALVVGLTSLVPSYVRHRNPLALILFGAGLLVIAASHLASHDHTPLTGLLMAFGGGLVAAAHYRNRKVCACIAHA